MSKPIDKQINILLNSFILEPLIFNVLFRFNTLEKDDNSILENLHRYLQFKKRETLWKPKKDLKEVQKGIWNENYLKNLHSTLKLLRFKNLPTKRTTLKSFKEFASNISTTCELSDDQTDQDCKKKFLIQKAIKGEVIRKVIEMSGKNFKNIIEEAKEEFSQHINSQNRITFELKQIEKSLKNDEMLQKDLKVSKSEDYKNISSLEKELQRLQGEKRTHALFILAERERYFRINNQKLDESFRNDAISLYLENVLVDGAHGENSQTNLKREYIRNLIQKIDKIANTEMDLEFNSKNKQEHKNYSKQSSIDFIKDHFPSQIVDKINCEHLKTKQNIVLGGIHENLFKEEFHAKGVDTQNKICSEIITDLIEKAIHPEVCVGRQESAEAEELASKMVDKILSEINFSRNNSIEEKNAKEWEDFDDISSLNESGMESSTDRKNEDLAKQVVKSALIDVLKKKSPKETDSSDF